MIYRRMTADDIEGVYEVEVSAFEDPWSYSSLRGELKNKLSRYIVGYVGAWYILDEAHITNVAVHKDFREKKIGNGLIEALIDMCDKDKMASITLEVRAGNFVAQGLYKKYGFLAGGVRKEYYTNNKEDAIIMWKQLREVF